MLKEAMTHRLKIEIIPERRAFDTSINDIDFNEFDLSKYDRRLRLNARVQTDKQVLLHELTPEMFDKIPPTSQLYENNEADTQTTRYTAKELDDEKFSDVITDKSEENRKSEDDPEGVKDNYLKQSDEKREDFRRPLLLKGGGAREGCCGCVATMIVIITIGDAEDATMIVILIIIIISTTIIIIISIIINIMRGHDY